MRRIITTVIILLLLCGVGYGVYWYTHRNAQTAGFRTIPLTRDEMLVTIAATGTLEPEEVVDVGAQVAGQIVEFGTDTNGKPIDYGSTVEQGKLLAKIDDTVYKSDLLSANAQLAQYNAAVQVAEADLLQNKAKLFQAQRDWDRAQKLGSNEALAQTTYDQYQSTFEVAKANVAVAEAQIVSAKTQVQQGQAAVDRAQRNLGYCTINAPVTGTIIDRRVNIGQTVVASLNTPSLCLIGKDLSKMNLWVPVNEADIGRVKVDQPVTFDVSAFPKDRFRGKVSRIRLNALMTSNVVTYTVEVAVDNQQRRLLPYLTANANFEVARREGALLIPNAALRWNPSPEQIAPSATTATSEESADAEPKPRRHHSGGASTEPSDRDNETTTGQVWIEDGKFVKPVQVKLGLTDGVNTELVGDALAENTQLIVGDKIAGDDAAPTGSSNPFLPQFRRGAGGGRQGGGGGGGRPPR